MTLERPLVPDMTLLDLGMVLQTYEEVLASLVEVAVDLEAIHLGALGVVISSEH